MKTHLPDCILRNGGYYNNWQFSRADIHNYINEISKNGIKFVEIGFLFLPFDKKKDLTAYYDKKFSKKQYLKKNISFASLTDTRLPLKRTKFNEIK
jgi:4-hydroxy 2-oxovalerate aldolase|tara:strand:- start:268 stop:555 length:288 start_codon:yes stop_codon:yes gene_type:complete